MIHVDSIFMSGAYSRVILVARWRPWNMNQSLDTGLYSYRDMIVTSRRVATLSLKLENVVEQTRKGALV